MPCVRQALINSGLAVDTTDIIMASWRDNTKSKYSTYLAQWLTFCERNGINYLQASTSDGLKYLTQVFQHGRQYGTVKAARSALSAIMPLQDGIPFGQIPTVSKFIKGVANLRPPMPKYTSVWHVSHVLNNFRGMGDNDVLSLKALTLKLVTLLCLVLIQRAQTIHSFDTEHIRLDSSGAHIAFPRQLKQSRPGYHPQPVFIPYYNIDYSVCPVRTLEVYLQRTALLRGGETKLLLSYVKPYKAITLKTVYRWLKTALNNAGIDTSVFQGHSCRVAGGSTAKESGVPITNILKMAGWASETVFARHYDKPVDVNVPAAILTN